MCPPVLSSRRPASVVRTPGPQLATFTPSKGFTLIELLVVIAIIGILAAIIIPVTGRVQTSAKRSASLANLKGLATASLLYANDHKGFLPYQSGNTDAGGYSGATQKEWSVILTPYLPTPERRWSFLGEAVGTRAVSSALVDPLIPDGLHHPSGDYGGSGVIFARPSLTSNVPKVPVALISRPSQTILAMSVKNGSGQGSWAISQSYMLNFDNTTTPLPNDWAGSGHYLCAFADGHSAVVPIDAFDTKAKRLALFSL
jgi:prepilin-type N-terminal cleavage/methylation domain-containing protein